MRRLDTAFRWSTFLTLVLASFCLAYTEESFLPGIVALVLPVGVLLAFAFIIEERWTISLYASNILGLFIAAGAALWIAYRVVQPGGGLADVAPSAMVLPYLGPVLMVLMLAIMFRSKQVHDFWWLHTVGLLEVTLACVLASDPFFGILLFVYLTCALWSLSLYYLHREHRRAERPGRAGRERPPAPAGVFGSSCRWALGVSALAGLLFLIVPRISDAQWDPFTLTPTGLSTGYSDGLDLNHSGQVQVSDRVAFEVTAQDAEGKPYALGQAQVRFRGAVLDMYERGRWTSRALELSSQRQGPRRRAGVRPARLPDYGPGQFFLTFQVDTRRANGVFLADPVLRSSWLWMGLPVESLDAAVRAEDLVQSDVDGSLIPAVPLPGKYAYRQVLLPSTEAGLGPPVLMEPRLQAIAMQQYRFQPVPPGIRKWTAELLQRLGAEGKLEEADFRLEGDATAPRGATVPQKKWLKVARVLSSHLAYSNEFTYSLQLRRTRNDLDPTEDFLRNVKQGHCVRFASALTLMLRSCRIPARVVNGFHGAEAKNPGGPPDGRYVVRNRQSHSWVEALVEREGEDGRTDWHWLTLDPTPGEPPPASFSWLSFGWLDAFFQRTGALWQNFVLDYNSDRRSEAAEAISNSLRRGQLGSFLVRKLREAIDEPGAAVGAAAATVLALVVLLWRKRSRRQALRRGEAKGAVVPPTPRFALACYERLLVLLNTYLQLVPRTAQTPRELASAAEKSLSRRRATATLADVPERIVRLLYRARYGRRPATETEERQADQVLGELEALLQQG